MCVYLYARSLVAQRRVYMYVCMHAYVYMHARMHAYIHVCMNALFFIAYSSVDSFINRNEILILCLDDLLSSLIEVKDLKCA